MYLTTKCALGYYIYFYNFEPNINFGFSDGINLNPNTLKGVFAMEIFWKIGLPELLLMPRATDLFQTQKLHYIMLFYKGHICDYFQLLCVFHTKGSRDTRGNVTADSAQVGKSKLL